MNRDEVRLLALASTRDTLNEASQIADTECKGKLEEYKSFETSEAGVAMCAKLTTIGPYLEEFITFHRIQGVTSFLLFVDEALKYPKDLMQKYMDMGRLEFVTFQHSQDASDMQAEVQKKCISLVMKDTSVPMLKWAIISSGQDFIYTTGDSDTKYLADTLDQRYFSKDCVDVPIFPYGSSFRTKRPDNGKLMIENYIFRGPSLQDPSVFIANLEMRRLSTTLTESSSNTTTSDSAAEPGIAFCASNPEPVSDIRSNRYMGSIQDVEERMMSLWQMDQSHQRATSLSSILAEQDKNDEFDQSASKFSCLVRAYFPPPAVEVPRQQQEEARGVGTTSVNQPLTKHEET